MTESMKVALASLEGKASGSLELSANVFGQKVQQDVLSRVIEWQRSKSRAGTHSTKTISEISGTTKKMYKQKGTGRARHGSARAAQFRHGAVALGPRVRSHEYSIQKKVKDLAMRMALSLKHQENKLVVLSDLNVNDHKTKGLVGKLVKFGIGSALFGGINHERDTNFARAYRNIKRIDALPTRGLNVLDIIRHDHLVLTQECVKELEQRLDKTNKEVTA